MTTKLHINLSQGLVEAEGSEDFVWKVYADFKDKVVANTYGLSAALQNPPSPNVEATGNRNNTVSTKSSASGKKATSKGYTLCKNLNLYSEGDKPSLEDFMKDYAANSNPPRYLLFTHYLKNIKGIEKVGPNEIYTCLKRLGGIKIPNIEQGLWDTSSKKGWLDTSSIDDVGITVAGENAIDLELRMKQKDAA